MAGVDIYTGITADSSGNIYITKQGGYNSIIQKYDSTGAYVSNVQVPDGYECLYITSDGTYVYAAHGNGLNKYDSSLNLIDSIVFEWISSGVVFAGSYIYVVYTDLTYQYKITKFDLSLSEIATAVISGSSGMGIGVYGSLIYIVADGSISSIPLAFTDDETLTPTAIFSASASYFTVDSSGNFIVSSDTLYVYNNAGTLIKTLTAGSGDGEFSYPVGIFAG